TADVKTKQQALETAKAKLADKQESQAKAQKVLDEALTKLDTLKAELATATAYVETAKAGVATAQNNLAEAKQTLSDLKNAPALLADAKAKLAEAQAKLETSKKALEEEVAKLEALKAKQSDITAKNTKIVSAYKAYLEAQAEAQRLEKIKNDLEMIKANGGNPVPVIDENGVVTGYVDGNATKQSNIQTTGVTTTATKKTQNGASVQVPVSTNATSWASKSAAGSKQYLPSTNDGDGSVVSIAIGMMLLTLGLAGTKKRKAE
ncbi:LPXTG cell wall anchor domain-containing protein, partial [Streptococcus hyointestinalis]